MALNANHPTSRSIIRFRWRTMTLVVCAAVFALCPVLRSSPVTHAQAAVPALLYALADHYITNYAKRASDCPAQALSYPTWTSWNSYDEGKVGSHWEIFASKASVCALGNKTAKALLNSNALPYSGGTSISKADWQGYALAVGHGMQDLAIMQNVPKGWKCFTLPSWWGANVWAAARLANHTVPGVNEFEGASGIAAGVGYCESGGKRSQSRQWTGGKFFTWSPSRSQGYDGCFVLKTKPDPSDPNNELPIEPYSKAHIWGDYNRVPC